MRSSRRFRLSARGRTLLILGVGLGLAAYSTGRVELMYLGVFLAVVPLVALAFVRFRKQRMGVVRRFSPAIAETGHPLSVSVEVRNLGSARTGEARWHDMLPFAPYKTPPSRLRTLAKFRGVLGRNNAVPLDYTVRPPRRGIVEIGPLVVDFADPFGLASGEITVGERQKLVVAPAIDTLPITGKSMNADDGSARAQQRRISGSDDEIMTREYRYGDPLRRVHWRSSAHRGELMVRQEEQRSHARATIVLDTHRAGFHDAGQASAEEPESDSFEWALSFTASVARHLQRTGFSVRIVETGFRQLASPEHREEFLHSLAAIELVRSSAVASMPGYLTLRADSGRSNGSLFAVVADAEARTLERLANQRAGFDRAVAFVVNPHNDAVLGALRHAGWNCFAVRLADDPAEVWRAATENFRKRYASA